jgi:hypothetical protein
LIFVNIPICQETYILDCSAIEKLEINSFMQMLNLTGYELLLLVSLIASIAGLVLLDNAKDTQADDIEDAERSLLMMTFGYWMLHCIAVGLQKVILPDWEIVLINLKITAALSYLLTFACVLSLPLHRMSVRQVE